MDRHNQTHNDIKPQNFLVKFKNGPDDLTQIEIVLTDFGMADSDSKGGTPVFASPECFEKKDKKSDIFSFGRVILFLLLTKNQFAKWLFVPIKSTTSSMFVRMQCSSLIFNPMQRLYLVSKMMSLTSRITLKSARKIFNRQRKNSRVQLSNALVTAFESVMNNPISNDFKDYMSELCDFRYHQLFGIVVFIF